MRRAGWGAAPRMATAEIKNAAHANREGVTASMHRVETVGSHPQTKQIRCQPAPLPKSLIVGSTPV